MNIVARVNIGQCDDKKGNTRQNVNSKCCSILIIAFTDIPVADVVCHPTLPHTYATGGGANNSVKVWHIELPA